MIMLALQVLLCDHVYMYVAVVPNRNSPPAILLRESFRDNGKVHNRTIANLSDWPPAKVEALRQVLKGATLAPASADAFQILRSQPHGHVAAVVGSLRKTGSIMKMVVSSPIGIIKPASSQSAYGGKRLIVTAWTCSSLTR